MARRSALWAAYGDALGWISERTDSSGLKKRTGGQPLRRPIAWTRQVGGPGGIGTLLPRGCYSDDSQLRLATGRAIGPNGFDVEAFAKVELPIWLSYGLGGGNFTIAAATNLGRPKVPWFANTFKDWTNSSGNGAATRIQPHVWAASALDDAGTYLPDVLRNTICTHSHPFGMLGSVFHALTLAQTMFTRSLPSADDLKNAAEIAGSLPRLIRNDPEVGSHWRDAFERESGAFDGAWSRAVAACRDAIDAAAGAAASDPAERYTAIVDRLRLRDPERRGSGMLTAVAAAALLWCEQDPEEAMRIAANELVTDTDTIASMAGALIGVTAESEPSAEVMDAGLFRSEANRLTQIACTGHSEMHRYPDLFRWTAPKKRADGLARTRDGGFYVRGLGHAEEKTEPQSSHSGNLQWQWLALESGQSLFMKRRPELKVIDRETDTLLEPYWQTPRSAEGSGRQHSEKATQEMRSSPADAVTDTDGAQAKDIEPPPPLDLQRALKFISENREDDKAVGAALRRVVNKGTTGQTAAFTAELIDLLREPGA